MLIIIARISEGKNTVGYRILDTSNNKTIELSKEGLIAELTKGHKLVNASLTRTADGVDIKGTNGDLTRYANIDVNGVLVSKPSLVVLFKSQNGFICANYLGAIAELNSKDAVKYAVENGIANGKTVTKDGKHIISSINGEYPETPKTEAKKERKIFVSVSDADSAESIKEKLDRVRKDNTLTLIGELSQDKTSEAIQYIVKASGFIEAIASKKADAILKSVKQSLGYIETIIKVGNRKAIMKNVTGLKAVQEETTSGCEDLFKQAIDIADAKGEKIKLSSRI